ncbi:hypothetical protein P691DRAFT_778175 [Macrolepiota fuliginosa MF-IS2]|uniref:Peptidase C14 caspase domain-containing protein n=1 Tax=Macrolepiota fuliginosa MF-IS2 TaxID=1400762 RepID=A0A9P5X740_9AGAR|nr:hypothetical protein P691DRAFT_778175 [Macrolepiota fuliginosa MF-IS2]
MMFHNRSSTLYIRDGRRPSLPIADVRKALLVGVGYSHCSTYALSGPQKDVKQMERLLRQHYHFCEKDITILSDDPALPPSQQPTYANITDHLKNFVEKDIENAQYWFLFCGHAKQRPEEEEPSAKEPADLGEEDGKDEYIIPVDAVDAKGTIDDLRIIRDNTLREHLADTIRPGSEMFASLDTCHSNTMMDLPHHRCNRVYTSRSRFHRLGRRALEIGSDIIGEDLIRAIAHRVYETKEVIRSLRDKKYLLYRRTCTGYCIRGKATEFWINQGRVICISACKDSQHAWEDRDGKSLTTWLVKALGDKHNPTLKELMRSLGDQAKENYQKYNKACNKRVKQNPQLSTQLPVYMNERLFLYGPQG